LKHARELFWHYWLPVLAMLLLIKLESTDALSGTHTAHHLSRLLQMFGMHLNPQRLELVNKVMRKSGHMVGYGLLGFCWFVLLRGAYRLQHEYHRFRKDGVKVRRTWWRPEWAALAVFLTFLVATAHELHQMSIASRTGSWWDVALDTTSALVVVMLLWARAARLCRNE